jgi:hypothetical protein
MRRGFGRQTPHRRCNPAEVDDPNTLRRAANHRVLFPSLNISQPDELARSSDLETLQILPLELRYLGSIMGAF